MTQTQANISKADPASSGMSERDLAELIGAFNDVTTKLHGAHEALTAEVTRLKRELREANEQIERSRRLAALGEMAAGIAHEVRNPLGSIRLYARMLEQDLADRPQERGLAVKIAGAVKGLDAVVGDVLAFSREMRVSWGTIESEALLRGAVQECVPEGDAWVRVRTELSEFAGDAGLLHRALVNVVWNAVEAMREKGGEMGLELRVRGAKVEGQAGWASIVVRDSGPGIPADVLPRMFNPFFTTRATGTGLGLAIVHRIVDAHGGRVSVRNVTARGVVQGAEVELVIPPMVRRGGGGAGGGGEIDTQLSAGGSPRGQQRTEVAV